MRYRSQKIILIALSSSLLLFSAAQAKNFTIYNSTNINQPYFSVNGLNGNVGIGLTNPANKLTVTASTSNALVNITQTAPWTGSEWALSVTGYTNLNGFRINAADGIRALHKIAAGGQMGFSTQGDDPITFTQLAASERMRIAPGGNIGIGTTTPPVKLSVSGGTGNSLYMNGGQISGLNSTPVNADQAVPLGYLQNNYVPLGSGAGGIGSGTSGQTLRHNGTSWVANSVLYNNGTNIGIGTSSPSSKLQVYGTSGRIAVFGDVGASLQTATPVNVSFGSTYGSSAPGSVNNLKWDLFTSASSGNRYGIGMSSGLMEFQAGGGGSLGFFVNQGTEAMRIVSSGNVGIGTTNPNYKFDVNGSVNLAGDLTIGGANKKIIQTSSASYTLPALGTRISFLNISSGSLCKVTLNTSENSFVQPIDLYISRSGVGGAPTLIRSDVKIHEHSYAVAFSSDTNGDVWIEKILYTTGRSVGLSKVEQLKGSCTILDGSATSTGVSVDQSTSGNWFSVSGGNNNIYYTAGNVGIGTTTPTTKLTISGGTGNVLNVGGGQIAGLNSTPVNTDQAVPLGYLQNNYVPLGAGAGGIGSGTSGQTLRHNGTSWVANSNLFNDGTNVGIGTSNPGVRLETWSSGQGFPAVSGTSQPNAALRIGNGSTSGVLDIGINTAYGAWFQYSNRGDLSLSFPILLNPNGGNIGIGTTNPLHKLQVSGDNSTLPTDARFAVVKNEEGYGLFMGIEGSGNSWLQSSTRNNANKYSLTLQPQGGNTFLNPSGGNVGIGTNSPTGKFTVAGSLGNTRSVTIDSKEIKFRGDGVAHISILGPDTGKSYLTIQNTSNNSTPGTAGTDLFSILSNGNIGINTTTPALKLVINGGTGDVLNVAGGQIAGLNSTPVNNDQAVSLGYLKSNYVPLGSGAGGIGSGTSGQTLRHNGTSWVANSVLYNNGTNIGIGTASPRSSLEVLTNVGSAAPTASTANVVATDNSPMAAGVGGAFSFSGKYTSTGTIISGAAYLRSYKMNAVDGDYGFGLQLGTRLNGSGLPTPAMTLDSAGNVGIGTTNPAYKLDVNYTNADSGGGNAIRVKSTDSGSTAEFRAENNLGYSARMFKLGSTYSGYKTLAANDIGFYNANAGNISILNDTASGKILFAAGAASTAHMLIDSNGNIGIATTTPSVKLVVNGGTGNVLNVAGGQIAGLNSTPVNSDQAVPLGYLQANYSPSTATTLWKGTLNGDIWNGDSGAGNVGIGTTNPSLKLDVNGVIGSNLNGGELRSYQTANGLYVSLKTTGNKSGIFRSNTDFFTYYDTSTGDTNLEATYGGSNILFKVQGSEKMRIANGGNVGIGLTNPSSILTVQSANPNEIYLKGNTSGSANYNAALIIAESNIDYRGRGLFLPTTDGASSSAWFAGVPYTGGGFIIGNSSTHSNQNASGPYNYSNAKLTILPSGNVGIGTSNPLSKLYVFGQDVNLFSGTASNKLLMGRSASESLSINVDDTAVTFESVQDEDSAGYGNMIFKVDNDLTADGFFAFQNKSGTNFLRINSAGNIGIATTTPSLKLVVNGGTGDSLHLAGGQISGLNSTPINADQAVPLGYLQANYAPLGSGAGSAFVQGGNSFGGLATLGTKDNNLLNFNTNNLTRMTIGASGNVGIGNTNPQATLHLGGGLILNNTTVADTDYTIGANDYIIAYTSISTNRTVTVPNSLCAPGRFFVIVDQSGSASASKQIIIDPEGTTPIVGQNTFSLSSPYNSVYIFCGNSAWYVL